jgi:hypothetical protein
MVSAPAPDHANKCIGIVVADILDEKNFQTLHQSQDEEDSEEDDFGLGVDMADANANNTEVLFDVISKCIQFLFRIGILIRVTGPVDRFQRAIKKSDPVPAWAYINHVRDKHSKLDRDGVEWLIHRLGNANAKRKQYMEYCRGHRSRLDADAHVRDGATEVLSSKATTFAADKVESLGLNYEGDDDAVTNMSASTTFDSENALQLPRLADLSPNEEPFECPICATLQVFQSEKAWRSVV